MISWARENGLGLYTTTAWVRKLGMELGRDIGWRRDWCWVSQIPNPSLKEVGSKRRLQEKKQSNWGDQWTMPSSRVCNKIQDSWVSLLFGLSKYLWGWWAKCPITLLYWPMADDNLLLLLYHSSTSRCRDLHVASQAFNSTDDQDGGVIVMPHNWIYGGFLHFILICKKLHLQPCWVNAKIAKSNMLQLRNVGIKVVCTTLIWPCHAFALITQSCTVFLHTQSPHWMHRMKGVPGRDRGAVCRIPTPFVSAVGSAE